MITWHNAAIARIQIINFAYQPELFDTPEIKEYRENVKTALKSKNGINVIDLDCICSIHDDGFVREEIDKKLKNGEYEVIHTQG